MIGKKLTKLLAALDPTEFRRMRKLFQSPIYTSNPHHLILYDYIRKYHPRFDSPRLEKEIVFEKVFGTQAFDDWKLQGLVTEFTRLTEEYFIMLDNRKNTFQRKRQLTKIYGERNLYDFFEKGTKRLLADLEASPFRDMDYHLNRAQLNEAWYFHPLKNKYDLKDTTLADLADSWDKYFVLGKMRYGIAAKNVERLFAKSTEIRFLDALEKEQKDGFGKDLILLQLYAHSYKLLTEQKQAYFDETERLFFQNLPKLNTNDRQLIFFNAFNFINGQLNRGKSEFNEKAFEWSKLGLEHQFFLENDKLSEINFGNIVMYGCRMNQFDWTENFIQDFQAFLKSESRTEVVTYNTAIWHYFQRNYDETYSILSGFSFSPAYVLRSRITIIRTLFELFQKDDDYFEVLNSNIHSFEIFILRNKFFSKNKLKPHLNFIRIVKKMAALLIKKHSLESVGQFLNKELNSRKAIGGKGWLLEKLRDYSG